MRTLREVRKCVKQIVNKVLCVHVAGGGRLDHEQPPDSHSKNYDQNIPRSTAKSRCASSWLTLCVRAHAIIVRSSVCVFSEDVFLYVVYRCTQMSDLGGDVRCDMCVWLNVCQLMFQVCFENGVLLCPAVSVTPSHWEWHLGTKMLCVCVYVCVCACVRVYLCVCVSYISSEAIKKVQLNKIGICQNWTLYHLSFYIGRPKRKRNNYYSIFVRKSFLGVVCGWLSSAQPLVDSYCIFLSCHRLLLKCILSM
jgi:hypothetical protein